MADDAAPFPYMRWAKAHLPPVDPRSLGLSGLPRPAHGVLAGVADPFLPGRGDPRPALREARRDALRDARRRRACTRRSAPRTPTSSSYLAFARGGRVAAETPAYESLHRLGAAVGAEVRTFRRLRGGRVAHRPRRAAPSRCATTWT